ncbi:hypothetical protein D3C73_1357720 [compost metagenome]
MVFYLLVQKVKSLLIPTARMHACCQLQEKSRWHRNMPVFKDKKADIMRNGLKLVKLDTARKK